MQDRDSKAQDWVAFERLVAEGPREAFGFVPSVPASPSAETKDLVPEDEQVPSQAVAQVSLLGQRLAQQQRMLVAGHYSHVVLHPSTAVHNCISCHLSDRASVFDRENVYGANVNVCGRGDRENSFVVDLDLRCRPSRYGIVILRGPLLLLVYDEPLACSSDVG